MNNTEIIIKILTEIRDHLRDLITLQAGCDLYEEVDREAEQSKPDNSHAHD